MPSPEQAAAARYTVFNAEQINGLPEQFYAKAELRTDFRCPRARSAWWG